jgi:hypothetical protein
MASKTRSNATSSVSHSIIPPSGNPDSKPTAARTSPTLRNSLSSAPPLKTLSPRKNISQVENFAMSALAPSMAVVFTLPFDTVKVRMQLQGEVSVVRDATGKATRKVTEKVDFREPVNLSDGYWIANNYYQMQNAKCGWHHLGLQEQSGLLDQDVQVRGNPWPRKRTFSIYT